MSHSIDKSLSKAQSHIKAGELREAEELYKQILSEFPNDEKATQGYLKLKAELGYNSSSSSEPPKEQVQRLISLYNEGRFEDILAKVKPLVSLFPKAIILYNLIAAANSGLKNLDQAIENFNKVLELNPKDAMAYFNIATIFWKKKGMMQRLKTIKNVSKLIQIMPNPMTTWEAPLNPKAT